MQMKSHFLLSQVDCRVASFPIPITNRGLNDFSRFLPSDHTDSRCHPNWGGYGSSFFRTDVIESQDSAASQHAAGHSNQSGRRYQPPAQDAREPGICCAAADQEEESRRCESFFSRPSQVRGYRAERQFPGIRPGSLGIHRRKRRLLKRA